jgi:hypothetical protein
MDLFSLASLIAFILIAWYTFRRTRRPTLSQRLEELAKKLGVEPEYGSREAPAEQPWGRSAPPASRTPTAASARSDAARHDTRPAQGPSFIEPAGAAVRGPAAARTRGVFPSAAARKLGIHGRNDLRRAVVLATVLERCPGVGTGRSAASSALEDLAVPPRWPPNELTSR